MICFTCNICGARNEMEHFVTEPATCACGSNVRLRALIHLLSIELFGRSLILTEFPKLKSIRGLGMSDKECYAGLLAEKFDYTNTYYDREPRLDFTESHPEAHGQYDFILSADVLEHIAPPVERALVESANLLKPHGFLGITVFCNPADALREHFPNLHEYRVVPLGTSAVLINRRSDGTLEIRDDLVFHGGTGLTLEMREFGSSALQQKLRASGFSDVYFLAEDLPEIGVIFDHDVSQPMLARKAPYVLGKYGIRCLIDEWRDALQCAWSQMEQVGRLRECLAAAEQAAADERDAADPLRQQLLDVERTLAEEMERSGRMRAQIHMASNSRWLRIGRRFGLGPNFDR